MTKNKIHYSWIILLALCIIVGLGKANLNNAAGLFIAAVSKDLQIGVGSLSAYLSIAGVVTLVFLPIGGKLLAQYNARVILLVAIVLQAGAFALFGLMNSVWGWYILSIPLAVGGVIITVVGGPIIIDRWFVEKKGLALGILTAVVGLFGAFSQPIIGNLITKLGWRQSYIMVGSVTLVVVALAIVLLIRNYPKDKNLLPYGEEARGSDAEQQVQQVDGIAFNVAKKAPAFFLLTLFFFVITAIASFTIHVPVYLIAQGHEASKTGQMMGIFMLGVFAGSLVYGYLTDKIGAKKVSLIAMVLGLLSIVLLMIKPDVVLVVMISLFFFGTFSSAIGTISPALTSDLFGSKDYGQIYASASIGLALASIIAIPAYGFLYDATNSYTLALITVIVLFVINIIAILLAYKNKAQLVQQGHWNTTKE